MPFSPKTPDFLFENHLNDSKLWYNEHKDEFKQFVAEPMKEFTNAVMSHMAQIDDQMNCTRISRIYRDARFAKGGSVFRENMWCMFSRVRDLYKSLPAFYFEISPDGIEYGCGYYCAATETMASLRKLILENDPSFQYALEAYNSQRVFELYGDMYKRNHFPEISEEKCFWLNRKNIGLTSKNRDWDMIFSEELSQKIADDFMKIAPIYHFFMKAEEIAADKK